MFSFFKRTTKAAVKSTPLSEFVRSKSADKKQVYVAALKRASESQNREYIARYRSRQSARVYRTCRRLSNAAPGRTNLIYGL